MRQDWRRVTSRQKSPGNACSRSLQGTFDVCHLWLGVVSAWTLGCRGYGINLPIWTVGRVCRILPVWDWVERSDGRWAPARSLPVWVEGAVGGGRYSVVCAELYRIG